MKHQHIKGGDSISFYLFLFFILIQDEMDLDTRYTEIISDQYVYMKALFRNR